MAASWITNQCGTIGVEAAKKGPYRESEQEKARRREEDRENAK